MPQLTAVIGAEEDVMVAAVTSLDSRLFVLFYPNEEKVTVYDTEKYTVQTKLTVAGLGHSMYNGLATCVVNECLYVGDYEKGAVHRVALSGDNEVLTWSVPGKPRGLSLSNARNLLVACYGGSKIREYDTSGKQVREIDLQSEELRNPWHAVQLTDGRFLVSRGKPVNDVVLLDEGGGLTESYNSKLLQAMKGAWNPIHLHVGEGDGFVLVVNSEGSDITMLKGSSLRSIMRSDDGGDDTGMETVLPPLNRPWTLHFNETSGRLYVGEMFGRVLVFDLRCR